MKYNLCLFMLSLLTAFSCRSEVSLTMDQAEALVQHSPDSALVILETISRKNLNTDRKKARYALIKSYVLDKNYIDVTSDSLTRIAVDYYSSHRDSKYKMWAWYYHALVQMNSSSYTSCIVALEEAEKEALKLNDTYQMGLIMRAKARVFKLSNNNPGAIECRKKAIECFRVAEKDLYQAYSEIELATDYINNKEYGKADSLLIHVRETYHNSSLDNYCNIHQAGIFAETDKHPELSIALYKKTPRKYFSLLDYGYLATSYEAIGQPDSADYWLSEGYSTCRNQADFAALDYMRSKIEIERKHYEEAYHLVDHAASVQDSLTRILLQQSVSAAQRDYYKSEAALRDVRIRSMKERILWGTAISVLIVFLLILAAISSNRKKDRLLQEQMARLALEERELERVNKDNAHLVGSLFSEKIDHFDKLSESFFRMEEGRQKDAVFKQIKELASVLRNDDALFRSLEKDLDRYCNGVMSKLQEQVPRIKGENLKLISLFFAGFSYETIQFILRKNSVDSLKTARSRFRKEILAAQAADADFFLKMLDMKKRPQAGTNENKGDC